MSPLRAHAIRPLALALALAACGPAARPDADLDAWLSPEHELTALVFLGTECPLSCNYTGPLNELSAEHGDVAFVGVFPLADDDEASVAAFREKYRVRFATRLDHAYELVELLKPSVTPEVFLVAPGGEVVYSGKIDNWAVELGRTRKQASEHYLADAIRSRLAGEEAPLRRVEPVGCFLPEEPDAARAD